ncbi:uncharacterized protein [Penaeus vannamei]|uniref:uncharacterized protein n=1 Tax=Penaeus vannamei TaxID=6689 RepID=UPI00387FA1E8
MKACVTLVLVALLVTTMLEETVGLRRGGDSNRRGRGFGGRGRGRGGRGSCLGKLCEAADDANTCRDCAKGVSDFKQEMRTCTSYLSVSCNNITATDLDSLTTCLTDALPDLADCF